MPANDESLKSARKAKKELDISKLSKVKNKKIARTFRRKQVIEPDAKLDINWRKLWAYVGIIGVSTLIVYGTSLFGKTVWNDALNFQIKTMALPVDTIWLNLVALAQKSPLSQPWVQATYFWDTISFPGNPAWYHVVNVSLHAMTCIYLFLFSFQVLLWLREQKRITFDPYNASLVAALLFMCHPLAAGAVSYISGRGGPLTAANLYLGLNLFMLGFFSFEPFPIIAYYFAAMLFFAIGIVCGVQAVFFPLLAVILAILLKEPKEDLKSWVSERWQDFAIFSVASIAALAVLVMQSPSLLDNGVDLPLLSQTDYLMQQLAAIVTYLLRYLVAPFGVSISEAASGSLLMPLAALGFIALAAGGVGIYYLRKFPLPFFGGIVALSAIVANLFFVQHELVSDSRYYVCLSGLALLAGSLLAEKINFNKQFLKIGLAVAVLLSGISIWRETTFMTDTGFWKAAVQGERSARNLGSLAQAQYQGGGGETETTAKASLAIDPKSATANEALGLFNGSLRHYKEAVANLKVAVETAKRDKTVAERLSWYQYELADAAMRAEDWPVAKEAATEALKVRPGMSNLHLALGRAFLSAKDPSAAYEEFSVANRLDQYNPDLLEPTAEACLQIGSPNYVAFGYTKAKTAATITRSLRANQLYIILALELGKIDEAKKHLDNFIKSRGTSPEAVYLLSIAEKMDHHDAEAQKLEAAALKVDPKIKEKIVVKPVDLSEMRNEMRKQHRQMTIPSLEPKLPANAAPDTKFGIGGQVNSDNKNETQTKK
ncbi:MAG TPA: tetratricopeptide repeat protein [Oculatellaceae cyanobacterium]